MPTPGVFILQGRQEMMDGGDASHACPDDNNIDEDRSATRRPRPEFLFSREGNTREQTTMVR